MNLTARHRTLAFLFCAGLAALASTPLRAQDSEGLADRIRSVKRIQREWLKDEARGHLFGEARGSGRARHREVDPDAVRGVGARGRATARALRAFASTAPGGPRLHALAPNVQVSNPAGEPRGSSQNEPSMAALGSNVLAAYNDWPDLELAGSIQGYSYSVDGGQTWTDGGMIPAPRPFIWTSDPVISVNEKTGDFYYVGLLEDTSEVLEASNGVGVVHGTFTGTTFQWDAPHMVRQVVSAEHFLDKPWMVADSVSDNVYVTYTDFFPQAGDVGNAIIFQRSFDRGLTWESPVTLSPPSASGAVQGSRPAVGPTGEVYVTWRENGPEVPGSDFLRIRRSPSRGAGFDPEHTVVEFFDNFGTGAPGFNREKGVGLPSIAIDRSNAFTRGRLYVAWTESINWYDDVPPLGTRADEVENNDPFALSTPFMIGQTLYGTFRPNSFDPDDGSYFGEFDSWSFTAEQDSSYVFWADTVGGSPYRLRVFCSDSLTRLTYTGHIDALEGDNSSVMIWTAPSTGTYYLDMTNVRVTGRAPGNYRIRTGPARRGLNERGRDERDVFVATSFDGVAWSVPVQVNDDPPHFDNWLPEVTVAADGELYSAWYDWRDSPQRCGGNSHIYLAFSDNAATTWTSLGAVTNVATDWDSVESNLIPNQGDYITLSANENAVYVGWTDGRFATGGALSPDIYAGIVSLLPEELQVTGRATVAAEGVTIDWQFRMPRVVSANVYRRDAAGRTFLRSELSDAGGHITFVDTTVSTGGRYVYNLGVDFGGVERFVGDVVASLPGVKLLVSPNPMRRSAQISFAVPAPGGPVEVMIHDLLGRRIRRLMRERKNSGQYSVVWDARDDDRKLVRPGVYLVRATVRGRTNSKRVTVIP